MDPRGSCAGTSAVRSFPLVRFSYKSACDTRTDKRNLRGDVQVVMMMIVIVMLFVMLLMVVAMVVLVVMVMMVLVVVLLVVWSW